MTGAATPGAGLLPARPARSILPGERIHVVGAAGAGASAAVLHGAWAGGLLDGCDAGGPSPYSAAIEAAGIPLAWQHDATHVTGNPAPQRLAVTKALTAIAPDHPELASARAAGIPIEPWQQVIADAAVGRTLVGVAGTHGKSTTAGWLVHVLTAAGMDPMAFVGALLAPVGDRPAATARRGDGPLFVVEADEYAGNFDAYVPNVAVLTNAEWDHPDVFANQAAVIDAFEGWLRRTADRTSGPGLVVNVGDAGVADLVRRLQIDWSGHVLATRLVDEPAGRIGAVEREMSAEFATADEPAAVLLGRIVESGEEGTTIELRSDSLRVEPVRVRLPLAGRHNAANALGVAAAAVSLGLPIAPVVTGLASFAGVGRRLERKGEVAGVVVFDDYGHHPTAIRETLAAVRQRAPGRRVWAVYEPLTYHRTAAMLDDFAAVLAEADAVAIADIWAGRDRDTTVASAAGLAEAVAGRNPAIPVAAPGSVEATAAWLSGEVRRGDAVLVMGGGQSYRIGELLLEMLADR